jgi:hypothetical protein
VWAVVRTNDSRMNSARAGGMLSRYIAKPGATGKTASPKLTCDVPKPTYNRAWPKNLRCRWSR